MMATRNGQTTIEETRALAKRIDKQQEQWEAEYEEWMDPKVWDNLVSRASAQFHGLSASEVVRLWESGTNVDGKPLTRIEFAALMEVWCAVFGSLPPSDSAGQAPATAAPSESEPLLSDNDLMTRRDVAKKLRAHVSSVVRMECDGRLPKAARHGARGRRHLARDIDAYIDTLDQQRHARPSRR